MKPFIALLLPATLYASEPAELNYKTAYLWQWVTACAEVMAPEFERQGMPRHFAMNWAITNCGCVIDGFRRDYPFESIITLTSEERRAAGKFYADQCGKDGITL